jgi:putative MATE family efflux protein
LPPENSYRLDTKSKNIKLLGEAPIRKVLWKFFLPTFTGVVVNSLYNIVDRIFLGQGVGAMALTGLSVVFPIMIIIKAFGMLIGVGSGVRVSIFLGKKDFVSAERVLGNCFILLIIVSIALTIIGFLIKEPLLVFFGASKETIEYANDYLDIILVGTIFSILGFSLNSVIRSEGNLRVAMNSMLISAGMNIVLDPIFIFGFGMEVKGAAWATVISEFVLCVWVLRHFFRSKKSIVKLKVPNFRLDKKIVYAIVSIGFSSFAIQFASSFVHGIYNVQLIKYGGDVAVGAMGIINSVATIIVMSIVALNMAAQPIIGYNYGAKNFIRIRQTLFICIKAATLVAVVGTIFIQAFPSILIKTFNVSSKELLEIGTEGLRIFMLAMPIVGFQIIAGSYFQSIGKAAISATVSLLRQVIVLIPILLILPNYWGLTGVWASAPISDIIAAVISFVFLQREIKKLNRAVGIS